MSVCNSYERLSLFLKLNFGITLLLFFSFLIFNDYTFSTFMFTVLAAISSAAILYLVLYVFLTPLVWLKKKVLVFTSLVIIAINFLLVVDFFIYRLWDFHINGMVLNIIFSPASYDSLKTGWIVKFAFVAVIAVLIYLQLALTKYVLREDIVRVKKHNKKFMLKVLPVLFLLVFSEKVISGFAVMYADVPLLERTKPIPLYLGVDFTSDMEKYFGLKGNTSKKQKLGISEKSKVNYPLEALSYGKINPVNIFVFAMDSTRYDVVNSEVMPNITEFSKDSWVYHNHFSGGIATRFGIFTLWYGLNANYWFSFLNAQKGPVLFNVLAKLGYQVHIFSSSSTAWPEFRKTVYFNIQNKITDEHHKGYAQNDIDTSHEFASWLNNVDKTKPIFSFVFLDAPHGPYSFPEGFTKFKPVGAADIEYLTVSKKDSKVLFNKYRNANYFSDSVVNNMINVLKQNDLYKNSVVIVTSDHGEEFFELGTFGHNSAFNDKQTHVPFIVHWPGGGHKDIYKMSSHLDVAPTLVSYVGVTTDPVKYSVGNNLLDKNYQRDFAFVGNWNNNAMLTTDYTYVFNNVNFFESKVYSSKTYQVVDEPKNSSKQKILLDVMEQNSRFVK